MNSNLDCNIDDETIRKVGLRISRKPINAQIGLYSRIFEYPHLENVFVMESDLYGNKMPENSCFLAFNGKHGLVGNHMSIETLLNSTVGEIMHIARSNMD